MNEYLNNFYARKQALNEAQKKQIFDLASMGYDEVLPLKLKLIVKYLNDNTVRSIDNLLDEANIIKK